MRVSLVLAALLCAGPALAQSSPYAQDPAKAFGTMTPQDAAKLNAAANSDPKARQQLDQVEKHLTAGGHPAGTLLQKTR